MSNLIPITIRITKKQKDWIDSHQEYNVSGMFRQMLDRMLEDDRKCKE